MASKSFKVTGARKDDGKDVDVTLQAVSPDDATEQANRLGIMVGTVTSVDESVQQGRRRQEQEACNQANGMGILVAEVNGATAHRVLAEEWLARPYRAIAIAAFVLGIISHIPQMTSPI